MPESSSIPIHGFCLFDWDGSQWVLQQDGNRCSSGFMPEPPTGGPADHGNKTSNVPGTCVPDEEESP